MATIDDIIEIGRRKTLALQSLARELNAAADVVRDGGMPESAKLLRMMAERAITASMLLPEDVK